MNDPKVELISFTDPYCSWCWATEPTLYRLRETYREQLSFRYVIGGLVEDMAEFFDGHNNIGLTAEVMPHWRMVSDRTGQPIDERLMGDITDPHWSTWPACTAVKAAHLQSKEIGEAYLRRLRRAALAERKMISAPEMQIALAQEVAGLDANRLQTAMADGSAKRAFAADRAECAQYGATGFPTILIRVGEKGVIANGYRSFETYDRAIQQLVGPLEEYPSRPITTLLREYGPLTTRELSEISSRSVTGVQAEMETMAARGEVTRLPVHGGEFWSRH
ncbi:MAG: DsbA family protein [Proteobacteria bacterium]|nr:DsbA family protein [Pseudomonadota bacterium]